MIIELRNIDGPVYLITVRNEELFLVQCPLVIMFIMSALSKLMLIEL